MSYEDNDHIELHNLKPSRDRFLAEVLSCLQKSPKELPSKYFYDEPGSSLFERICTLDEYYIPRVEGAIMLKMPAAPGFHVLTASLFFTMT